MKKYSFLSFLLGVISTILLLYILFYALAFQSINMGYRGYGYILTFSKNPLVFSLLCFLCVLAIIILYKLMKKYFLYFIQRIQKNIRKKRNFDWENID